MKFGKVKDIQNIQFILPDSHPDTAKILAKEPNKQNLNAYIGCPAWANKTWIGKIYPPKTPARNYLKFYAVQFNAIELNTTFYRIPNIDTVERWYNMTGSNFKFCPKIPQIISHHKKLEDCNDLIQSFTLAVNQFQEKLGTCFMVLPSSFNTNHLHTLEIFCHQWPASIPLAIEFRNPNWFARTHIFNQTFQLLAHHNISSIITDTAGRRDVLHQRLSTSTAFIRLVGNELHPTDYSRVDNWVQQISAWQKQYLQNLYIFVHQPEETLGPELVNYFIQELNAYSKLELRPLNYLPKLGIQSKLF